MKTFKPKTYINKYPKQLLEYSKGRKALCAKDPILFALLYLPHHISFEDKPVALADFHLDMGEYIKTLAGLEPGEKRNVIIAPRGLGKSTWTVLIAPIFLAAFMYHKYIMLFSASETQSIQHLQSLRHELETNELLNIDFPELCQPLRSKAHNRPVNQSATQLTQENGFTFAAKGIDSSTLGSKFGNTRPSLLLLDDIEVDESRYSVEAAGKRLQTLLNSVLPLNINSKVLLIGTTTRPDSIIHQCQKVNSQWNEYVKSRDSEALSQFDNYEGEESLIKPAPEDTDRYGLETCQSVPFIDGLESLGGTQGTNEGSEALRLPRRSEESLSENADIDSELAIANIGENNDVKSEDEKEGESTHNDYSRQNELGMFEDPAFYDSLDDSLKWVIDHRFNVKHYGPWAIHNNQKVSAFPSLWSTDFLKSIAHTRTFYMNYLNTPVNLDEGYWRDDDIKIERPEEPFERVMLSIDPAVSTNKTSDFTGFAVVGTVGKHIYVIHTEQLKGSSEAIRQRTNELVAEYAVQLVYLEINMGNDLWRSVFDGLETKIRYFRSTEKKEIRVARALDQYKKQLVSHCKTMNVLEEQQFNFPKGSHDDVVDATAAAINYFTSIQHRPSVKVSSYI